MRAKESGRRLAVAAAGGWRSSFVRSAAVAAGLREQQQAGQGEIRY